MIRAGQTARRENGRPGRRQVDVVVVGGGQAGISLSYYLKESGIPHVVLERDRPFSSWENRWDGFRTNTPNWMNTLPMLPPDTFPSNDPSAFATREELLEYLHRCLEVVDPPIETGCTVERVVQFGNRWEVHTSDAVYDANSVAICSGAMSDPRIPEAATETRGLMPHLHSSHYRNPSQIETPNVLVVGGASSGVQICRLLGESGRFDRLALAGSDVLTLPDRILGFQTHRFLHAFGLFDVRRRSLLGRFMYSGLETRGDPIMRPAPKDLKRLFDVELYGRFVGVNGNSVVFDGEGAVPVEELTIIWCTGFRAAYGFIEVERPEEAFDASGSPSHVRGVVDAASGLYFVGLRYQHTVASHDLYGVGADAEYIARRISERLGGLTRPDVNAKAGF